MNLMHKAVIAVVTILAVGNASAQKPELPYNGYITAGKATVILIHCVANRHMSIDVAKVGFQRLDAELSAFDYNQSQLEVLTNLIGKEEKAPTATECADISQMTAPDLQRAPQYAGPQPQENAWQNFLQQDRERSAQEKSTRDARVEQADRALLDSVRGAQSYPSFTSPATQPARSGQPGYMPEAVYPESACVGAIVQGKCVGSVQSTEPVRRCMGAMVNGACTGPVILSK